MCYHKVMKNLPITLSIPEDVLGDLHLYIVPRKISEFVTECVSEGIKAKKERLSNDFRKASTNSLRTMEMQRISDDD